MTNPVRRSTSGTPKEQRIPPQAVEAERAVLGAMMLGEEAIGTVVEFLDETCFYRDSNRRIFESIVSLYQKGEPADLVTVREELKTAGHLEGAGALGHQRQHARKALGNASVGAGLLSTGGPAAVGTSHRPSLGSAVQARLSTSGGDGGCVGARPTL